MPGSEGQADDRALVKRAAQGDRDAFGTLVLRHQTRVFNVAYQVVRNREDALDVAQEAFAKAFASLSSFKGEAGFTTWIHRIVVNLAIDCLRRRRRGEPGREPAKDLSVLQVPTAGCAPSVGHPEPDVADWTSRQPGPGDHADSHPGWTVQPHRACPGRGRTAVREHRGTPAPRRHRPGRRAFPPAGRSDHRNLGQLIRGPGRHPSVFAGFFGSVTWPFAPGIPLRPQKIVAIHTRIV